MIKRFAIAALIVASPAFAQGVDPLVGTWKLNLDKSTSATPIPQSQTNTYVVEGQNITNTTEGVDAQGRPFKIVYQHIYDGQPHPTTGDPNIDSSAYARVGNSINGTLFKNGKAVMVGQGVVSPGKTFTLTAEGITPNGQPYHSILVFDRQ
jgi:hypothetical protein